MLGEIVGLQFWFCLGNSVFLGVFVGCLVIIFLRMNCQPKATNQIGQEWKV